MEDTICEKDKVGFEAIHHLHLSIDDDKNGNLDRSESDEVGTTSNMASEGHPRGQAVNNINCLPKLHLGLGFDQPLSCSDKWYAIKIKSCIDCFLA